MATTSSFTMGSILWSFFEWGVLALLLLTFFVVMSPLLPTKKYISSYVVITGSMDPTVPPGALVFVKPTPAETVKVGDVIAFTSPEDTKVTVLHRVTEVMGEGAMREFVTKGDNNDREDNWIVGSKLVKGTSLWYVPYIGHIVAMLRTKEGYALLIGLPALIFSIMQIQSIWQGIREEIEQHRVRLLARRLSTL